MSYKKVLDVSTFDKDQKDIDWDKVRTDGIDSVIIRAGYSQSADADFVAHIKGAIDAGFNIGIYWFSYAWHEALVKAEAEYCIKTLAPYKEHINMPVFYDAEGDTLRYAKEQGHPISNATLNDMAIAFCDAIEAAGYVAGIYFNKDYRLNRFTAETLARYKRWYAYYNSTLDWTDCHLWQYTSTAEVDGVYPAAEDVSYLIDPSIIRTSGSTSSRPDWGRALQESLNAAYGCDLAIDGSIGPKTQARIRAHYLFYRMPTIKNVHVSWLQDAYNAMGYTCEVDGSYGPATAEVTRQFQRNFGLVVDGKAGLKTHLKILDLL